MLTIIESNTKDNMMSQKATLFSNVYRHASPVKTTFYGENPDISKERVGTIK